MAIPQFAQSFIVESAAKAKHGDVAAIDFLICHCAHVIASADRHDLVKIFASYNENTRELADRTGVKREQIEREMELCRRSARNGDAEAIVRIRRYLLDLCLKAPYAVWLSFNGLSLKELPKREERSNLLLPMIQ